MSGSNLNKKILVCSILVIAMLLLMPSIPAIQQKTIKEEIKQDLKEKLETINLNYIEEIEDLEWIRHPILFLMYIIAVFRGIRGFGIMFISSEYVPELELVVLKITHPILFLRGAWLAVSASVWIGFWFALSQKYGWNW